MIGLPSTLAVILADEPPVAIPSIGQNLSRVDPRLSVRSSCCMWVPVSNMAMIVSGVAVLTPHASGGVDHGRTPLVIPSGVVRDDGIRSVDSVIELGKRCTGVTAQCLYSAAFLSYRNAQDRYAEGGYLADSLQTELLHGNRRGIMRTDRHCARRVGTRESGGLFCGGIVSCPMLPTSAKPMMNRERCRGFFPPCVARAVSCGLA